MGSLSSPVILTHAWSSVQECLHKNKDLCSSYRSFSIQRCILMVLSTAPAPQTVRQLAFAVGDFIMLGTLHCGNKRQSPLKSILKIKLSLTEEGLPRIFLEKRRLRLHGSSDWKNINIILRNYQKICRRYNP